MVATKVIPFDAVDRLTEKLDVVCRHMDDNDAEIRRIEEENRDLENEERDLRAALDKVQHGETDTIALVIPHIDRDPILAGLTEQAKAAGGDWDQLREIKARYDARVDALFAAEEEGAVAEALRLIAA